MGRKVVPKDSNSDLPLVDVRKKDICFFLPFAYCHFLLFMSLQRQLKRRGKEDVIYHCKNAARKQKCVKLFVNPAIFSTMQ